MSNVRLADGAVTLLLPHPKHNPGSTVEASEAYAEAINECLESVRKQRAERVKQERAENVADAKDNERGDEEEDDNGERQGDDNHNEMTDSERPASTDPSASTSSASGPGSPRARYPRAADVPILEGWHARFDLERHGLQVRQGKPRDIPALCFPPFRGCACSF